MAFSVDGAAEAKAQRQEVMWQEVKKVCEGLQER